MDSNPGMGSKINLRVFYDNPPVDLRIFCVIEIHQYIRKSTGEYFMTIPSRYENILVDSNPGVGSKINWRVLYDYPPVDLGISWWTKSTNGSENQLEGTL